MSNALRVLAECLDKRTGRRFKPGETFDPPPTIDQAKRLIAGGCLPEAALKSAIEPEASAKAVTVAMKVDTSTATADIAALQKRVEEVQKAAEIELARLNNVVEDARASADAEVAKINDGVSAAQAKANADIAEIETSVPAARKKADDEIKAIEAEVEKAREAAAKIGDGKKS